MKKFLCYDTNDAASGKIGVNSNGVLSPNATVPSTNGTAYQQLVTDGDGNVKWEDKPFGMEKGAVIRSVSGLSSHWSSYNYQQYSYRTSTDIQNTFAPLSQITNTEAIRIEVNGVLYNDLVIEQRETGVSLDVVIYSDDCPIYIQSSLGTSSPIYTQVLIYSKSLNVDSVKVIDLDGEGGIVKKIDAQYLYQADWNENDSSSPAYILNKPESLGGVTWFSLSFANSSWEGHASDIKKGETWSSGVSTTSEELLDAFKNGLVRAHITDKESGTVDWFGTLDGVYHYTGCGYTNDDFTFTVNHSKSAKISYTKS